METLNLAFPSYAPLQVHGIKCGHHLAGSEGQGLYPKSRCPRSESVHRGAALLDECPLRAVASNLRVTRKVRFR